VYVLVPFGFLFFVRKLFVSTSTSTYCSTRDNTTTIHAYLSYFVIITRECVQTVSARIGTILLLMEHGLMKLEAAIRTLTAIPQCRGRTEIRALFRSRRGRDSDTCRALLRYTRYFRTRPTYECLGRFTVSATWDDLKITWPIRYARKTAELKNTRDRSRKNSDGRVLDLVYVAVALFYVVVSFFILFFFFCYQVRHIEWCMSSSAQGK